MRKLLSVLSAAAILLLFLPVLLPAQGIFRSASDAREHGFENGYRDGFTFGQNPQLSNREQDIVNQRLREADKDYQPAYGPREQYHQGYTDGFREGMEDSRGGKRTRQNELFRRDPNLGVRRDDRIQAIPPVRNSDDARYHGAPLDAAQHGLGHGYRDGFAFGQNNQVSNREQDIVNQRLREADKDYQSAYGPREQYRQGYADGFREGMEDGRLGKRSRLEDLFRWPDEEFDPARNPDDRLDDVYAQNQWPALHVADDIGYRDGFNQGLRDHRERRKAQPRRQSAWQLGLHGFGAKGASKGQYRDAYRVSYELGYRDGFGKPR